MQSVTFGTEEPFDHVTRALDMLRTMGFGLESLSITKADDGCYHVDIRYEQRGDLSAQTFLDRLTRNGKRLSVLKPRTDAETGSACR